ncbi:MAG: 4Fe-4S dicluster domain-containing protein [Terriglobales bacterium]
MTATKQKALLIDITKCVGCHACDQACREGHGQPLEQPAKLTATAFTVLEEHDDKYVRRMCQHCEDPACASACLVGALEKSALGPVTYAANKCVGCRYCMVACPYQVPKYQWSKLAPFMQKCDMCYDRVSQGQQTRCAEACPTGATLFGDRDELIMEARKRMIENPAYVRRIYGEHELGGASVMYISDVPFEKLGFVVPPHDQPMPKLSQAAMGDTPTVVLVGGTLLTGLYWITQRRREVLLAESKPKADEERS